MSILCLLDKSVPVGMSNDDKLPAYYRPEASDSTQSLPVCHFRVQQVAGACGAAGHWKLAHTVQNLVLTQAHLLVSFTLFAAVRTSPALFASFGFHTARPAIIAFMLFQFISAPLEEARSRPMR